MKLITVITVFVAILPACFTDKVTPPVVTAEDNLLDNIVVDCAKKPSLSCISKNAFRYLDGTFNSSKNWDVTDSLKFERNARSDLPEVEISRKGRNMEDVTDALYEKGVHFLTSHDLSWKLPETFFGGALVKVTAPPSAESRTLFHVELLAPEGEESEETTLDTNIGEPRFDQGRLFIKKLFGKHIKKRLLLGFFALLLIIKLIKIKLFFLLPLILGVGTVKKLAIKFLFFIFPALAALFKSCHHHHHHVPVKQYHLHTVKHSHPHHDYHHDEYSHGPPDWLRRNEYDPSASSTWEAQNYYSEPDFNRVTSEASPYSSPNYLAATAAAAKQTAAQEAYKKQLQRQAAAVNKRYPTSQIPSPIVPHKVSQLSFASPLHKVDATAAAAAAIPVSADSYDPFYSPKLDVIDEVFLKMGFREEGCRERLVCSMYKTPTRFSPNSNLISAELSVDPSELRTPSSANVAVRRFFKYIQAAKDGQDQNDCLYHYPNCNINTEP